jgi:hypothetical protein
MRNTEIADEITSIAGREIFRAVTGPANLSIRPEQLACSG